MAVLFAVLAVVLTVAKTAEGYTTYDTGAGINYKLSVTKDVWLERGSTNYNSYEFFIVGTHPGFLKKRSLIQFESLPDNSCSCIISAKMYLNFRYAHKASYQSVQQVPYISRTLQVHQIKKDWSETQATSTYRQTGVPWTIPYLGLDDTDASSIILDNVTMYTSRPSGFVEFDITTAMNNWYSGQPNYGVVVWATNEDIPGRDLRFYSKSATDSATHAFVNVLCDYSVCRPQPSPSPISEEHPQPSLTPISEEPEECTCPQPSEPERCPWPSTIYVLVSEQSGCLHLSPSQILYIITVALSVYLLVH